MDIRAMKETDLESCSDIFVRVFSSAPWNEVWTHAQALTRLSHFFSSRGFIGLLAENRGVNGFAMGNTEPFQDGLWFYLREMCVDIPWQNQGIGGQLLCSLEQSLVSSGIKHIYLLSDRAIPATGLYQKQGFNIKEEMALFTKQLVSCDPPVN